MLRTLQAPPRRGSLQESVLILLLMKLEAIEHSRFRALAQIMIDKEKAVETFNEYMKVAFPYMEAAKGREKADALKALESWVKRGPFGITPLQTPTMKSRLKQRVFSRPKVQTKQEANELYKKLGTPMPWNKST